MVVRKLDSGHAMARPNTTIIITCRRLSHKSSVELRGNSVISLPTGRQGGSLRRHRVPQRKN